MSRNAARFIFIAFSCLCFSVLASETNPIGQSANYRLDTNPNRTSSKLKSGTFHAVVTKASITTQGNPAYEVDIDYKLQVAVEGLKQGTQTSSIDQQYFSPEFMETLQTSGQYIGDDFSAAYQGIESVTTMDGSSYPNCDKILLYNFRQNQLGEGFVSFFRPLNDGDHNLVQNLKIVAHIFPNMPVLGAVQIDLSGQYNGRPIMAGADYVPDSGF